MAKHFGIDFGTTNSAVFCYELGAGGNVPYKVGDVDGRPFPSVVAIDHLTQEVMVGRQAKERIIQLRSGGSHLVVESVKGVLDKDLPYPTPTRNWSSEEIATLLFQKLADKTRQAVGEPLREAVIAIPVGMSLCKRSAIRRAAQSAGITVRSFVSESTAAYIAHAAELQHCRYVAVFDWGGGTLDISVLEVKNGCIIERYTDGLEKAGDYIDLQLAQWLHTQIAERHGLRLAFETAPPRNRQILINEAERCKLKLQQDGVTQESVMLSEYVGISLVEQVVNTEVFRELVSPIVAEAVDKLITAVEAAKLSLADIGKLVVVGGSSKLLALQEALRRHWPYPNVIFPTEADWDIARGAAWLAAHPGSFRTAESIGLELADSEYHAIFPAGTQLQEAAFNLHFGLVENSSTATFLFATRGENGNHPRHIGTLHTKCNGFSDEVVSLKTQITNDLIFEAFANSQSRPEKEKFTYDRLKWMYEIPHQ